MVSGSSEPARHRTIWAIYGLGAALLLLGLLFGRRDATGTNRIPKAVRMLSSALVLTAALLRRGGHRASVQAQAGLVAAGMSSGFLGDLIMAEIIPLPEHVLWGMLAFGVGHTYYMRALLRRTQSRAKASAKPRWMALIGAWLIGLLGWWALVRNPKIGPALNYGALAYALLLSSMGGLAVAIAAQDQRYTPVAAGGALFLASDMLLASELFRGTYFPQIGDVVWLTYISGQALIVGGMAMAEDEIG